MLDFNIGQLISLGDLELALDYINNREIIGDDIKKKLGKKEVVKQEETVQESVKAEDKLEVAMQTTAAVEEVTVEDELEVEGDIEEDDFEVEGDIEDEDDIEVGGDIEEDDFDVEGDIEIEDDTEDEYEMNIEEEEPVKREEYKANVVKPAAQQFSGNVQQQTDVKIQSKADNVVSIEAHRHTKLVSDAVRPTNAYNQLAKTSDKKLESHRKVVIPVNRSGGVRAHQQVESRYRQVENNTQRLEPNYNQSKIDLYSSMDEKALYREVRKFLEERNVRKAPVERSVVEKEFGKENIDKLIKRGYLVCIGRGITIGM